MKVLRKASKRAKKEMDEVAKSISWLHEEIRRQQAEVKLTPKQGLRLKWLKNKFGSNLDMQKLQRSLADQKELLKVKSLQLSRAKYLEEEQQRLDKTSGKQKPKVPPTTCNTGKKYPRKKKKPKSWRVSPRLPHHK